MVEVCCKYEGTPERDGLCPECYKALTDSWNKLDEYLGYAWL